MRCVFGVFGWENMKPDKFCMYPCRGAKAYAPKCPATAVFGSKIGRVLGVSLLGRMKSGAFLAYVVCGNMKPDNFLGVPVSGAKAYAPKCPSTMVWA